VHTRKSLPEKDYLPDGRCAGENKNEDAFLPAGAND
jgi:hypothetical protein